MINSYIRIPETGNGAAVNMFDTFGFIYLSSDHYFSPPEKKRDSTSYAEKAGENTDARTVYDTFDYKIRFLIDTPDKELVNANAKIAKFNRAIREQINNSEIFRCRRVVFHDIYKRCIIVGIAEPISLVDEKDYHRRENVHDCVVVEFTIHVDKPMNCEFNT